MGYSVDIFERSSKLGGMANLIPDHRLDKHVLESDIQFLLSLGNITAKTGVQIEDPQSLLKEYDAICVTTGLWKPIELGIEGEALAIRMVDLLADPGAYHFSGRVAVIGGGATALDCAVTAKGRGAAHVELFMLEKPAEMPLTAKERQELLDFDIEVNGRIRVNKILSDGEQVTRAYQAGWAGVVMKTAFNNVPIHIPGEYMVTFGQTTYGNADNVSGHPLDRVCREVEQLVRQWPDRLTMASTGGPVTGHDESDALGWQSNTKKLEAAGVMGIEYSLSCPQGGDGTEGDIVSQNAALTAKIIDWIMQVSDPDIPKLFKLTAAVTSIIPILRAIKGVLAKYPHKKAGITLANSFPTLAFRPAPGRRWEEGVIVGMSGEGVTPISYLTLANAVPEGIEISGNGGPTHYKAAADFLALGVKTVQFCTIVMKYGYGIIRDLESGTAFLMQERGIGSMQELIGIAQPNPVTGFMELSPVKKISQVIPELCTSCGNCARCPYLAIALDENGIPHTDPARCIGCSICAKKCFTGALYMRTRTPEEAAALQEA